MTTTVAFDAGTSGSKILATFRSCEYPYERIEKHFLVCPFVRQLTQTTYEDLLDYAQESKGLSTNLVSYLDPNNGERVYWEVGENAIRPGLLSVGERKFEKLLAKILAFLGYLIQQEIEEEEVVELNLGILLPFDEIEDRQLLARWLKQLLNEGTTGFDFNGERIDNIHLHSMDCKPEGYGIYKANPSERVAVLIIGHSDSSWLYFNNEMLNTKLSRTLPETGMHDFLQNLNFPISYELEAARLLAQAGAKVKPKVIAELTQTKSQSEIQRLQQAIAQAKPQYWADRRAQFGMLNVKGIDKVLVSGGAANYFAAELTQLFNELFGLKLYWGKGLMLEFFERFGLEKKSDLLHRFADDYGYYRKLLEKQTHSQTNRSRVFPKLNKAS